MKTDKEIYNWILLALIAFLGSIQLLLLTMRVFATLSFVEDLGLWLVFFIASQIGAALFYQSKSTKEISADLQDFLIMESLLTFFLLSALVKMIFYDYKVQMASYAYHVLLGLAILNKIFWPDIRHAGRNMYRWLLASYNTKLFNKWLLIVGSLLMVLIVFVPNYQRVLARMYIGEQFHHYDDCIMGPGWAALNGHTLDWDQLSEYGVGMPYIWSRIARGLGGFSYEHVFLVLMSLVMIYYVLLFWFSCYWFNSIALALSVVLWGIRVQMFHPGDYPFVLTYPSATVIRYFFDIFVMAAIFLHLQKGNLRWLIAAGILSGLSVFYVDSTGVFLVVAYYFYIFCLLLMPYTRRMLYHKPQDIALIIAYLFIPLAVIVALFWQVEGPHLFSNQFWHNFSETVEYFLSGIGTYPMNENFKYHNFWAGLVGFLVPCVWVFTLIFVGAMCFLGKISRRNLMVLVLCVYGLGVNHYYIARAVLTSYYVTGLPFVLVLGYWIKWGVWQISQRQRVKALMVALSISIYALVTNHNFMAYPNIFNWSRNPMVDFLTAQPLPADLSSYFEHLNRKDPDNLKLPTNSMGETDEKLFTEHDFATDNDLIDFYHKDFDFSKDAQMIDSLVPDGMATPVISSFEIKILIQSRRPPFFYYFPLVNSRPKHMRVMPINFLHTSRERFDQKAIDQLSSARPEYVFLEKIFLYNPPKAYADLADNIIPIVDYVKKNYAPYKIGEYLVAMKKRS